MPQQTAGTADWTIYVGTTFICRQLFELPANGLAVKMCGYSLQKLAIKR